MIETTYTASASPAGAGSGGQYRQQASATAGEADRRAARRYKAQPGSTILYIEGAGAIRDLSMNDVFVLDVDPLEVGTPITFSVLLGNENVTFQGIVRRSVPQEGMGIQLTEVPREMRRRLVSHIACLS